MKFFPWYDYIFWLPLFFWFALYFWFWRFSNPLYLKKMVRFGKKWAVVPGSFSKNPAKFSVVRIENVVFSVLVSLVSAYSVAWILEFFRVEHPEYGLGSFFAFILLSVVLYKVAGLRIGAMYQSAYFLEYRRVRYETERKGNFRSEFDVQNRTVWSFTRKLSNAETHGRLWKYVNAMAKTKKIPPDIYAETMYV